MPIAYFVSDIHITAPDSARARLFEQFLRTLTGDADITHLFLLGDIFDLWVADHSYFISQYRAIIDNIRRLTSKGVEIIYFEGNHDLYLQFFWGDQLGVTVHEGPCYIQLGDRLLRVEHGDQMDPDDKGYHFLRWLLRTPAICWTVRNAPGKLIARIGARASASSRAYTSNTKSIRARDAVAKIHAHAKRAYLERPFDIMLSGHVHVRDDCNLGVNGKTFRTVNLGSWLDAPCYFRIHDQDQRFFELESK